MPALLILTIAQEPARALLAWRFLMAIDGGLGRLNDKHWLRRAADFAGDLWTAGGAAGGDCNGLCRGCDVSFRSGSAGARSKERARFALRGGQAGAARHPKSHGPFHLDRRRLVRVGR